ncbi:MAG: hypothetical protein IKR50_06620 [Prevotella sp.]|nr:hypothetical protein [Prevotella sp.]
MANKRTLKRTIKVICGELLTEAVAATLYGNEAHRENADALLFAVVKMQSNFVSRVSHPEPGMKAKTYFRDLRSKLAAQVGELADQINNL